MSNQDPDVALAALFLSHKLYDVHLISVTNFCNEQNTASSILLMEKMILRELRYKVSISFLFSKTI